MDKVNGSRIHVFFRRSPPSPLLLGHIYVLIKYCFLSVETLKKYNKQTARKLREIYALIQTRVRRRRKLCQKCPLPILWMTPQTTGTILKQRTPYNLYCIITVTHYNYCVYSIIPITILRRLPKVVTNIHIGNVMYWKNNKCVWEIRKFDNECPMKSLNIYIIVSIFHK